MPSLGLQLIWTSFKFIFQKPVVLQLRKITGITDVKTE